MGSLIKDDGYGNQNGIPKCNLALPSCAPCTVRAHSLVTGRVRTVFRDNGK